MSTTTTTPREALRARGVAGHVADRLSAANAPDLIGAWCAYAARHRRMGPGALVVGIRSGEPPPSSSPAAEPAGCAPDVEIIDWLRAHLPEVCDPRDDPHPAAVLAVRRLHFRYGRGSVTARAHAAVIRAEVRAARKYDGELP